MIGATSVKVASGVDVFICVAVAVSVGTDAVCVKATLAVCTINVLIALGLSVDMETGTAMDGTHAIINVRAVSQSNNFFLGDCILSNHTKFMVLREQVFLLVFQKEKALEIL